MQLEKWKEKYVDKKGIYIVDRDNHALQVGVRGIEILPELILSADDAAHYSSANINPTVQRQVYRIYSVSDGYILVISKE